MRPTIAVAPFLILSCSLLLAQESSFQDPFLEHLAGEWILQGTIAGQETTHDITVEWVLAHQYLQIHEVSREKNANGGPAYEAIVYIGWDAPTKQYACLWLDVTGGGGLTGQAIGHGKRTGDTIPFFFKESAENFFHNTFVYNKNNDTWQWIMDNDKGGKREPFARVTLTRK